MENSVLTRAVERRVGTRRAAAADDVRRLIDAGLAVMRRDGSIDPKVSAIVKEAGLSNQAFYRHFESKDELLLAIMAEGQATLIDFLERKLADAVDPAHRVSRWVEGILAQARNPRAAAATKPFAVNAGRLAHHFPDDVRASGDAMKAPLLAALREAGSKEPERDADAMYTLAVGAMERHLIAGTRPSPREVAHLASFALRGMTR